MKKIGWLLMLLWLLLCGNVSAQEVVFNAHWLNKEYQRYFLTHQTYVLQKNDTTENEILNCQLDVLITDSTHQAYRIEWRLYDFKLQSKHYLNTRWVQSLKDFSLVYKVSPVGVLLEFNQEKDFHQALEKSIDLLFKHYEGLPALEARERLYAFAEELETFVYTSIQQFHQAYGRAYVLGEVMEVPDQIEQTQSKEMLEVMRFKKLESSRDDIATLVVATVPDTVLYTADSTRLQWDNTGAIMMHIPTGWPVYSYDNQEFGIDSWKEGMLNEITLKK